METGPDYVPTFEARSFLGLHGSLADPVKSRFVLLPIPYDGTVSYQVGTRRGPRAIIDASIALEEEDEEFPVTACDAGICTLSDLVPVMTGPAQMSEVIRTAACDAVTKSQMLIGLGGEHGITPPLFAAAVERFGPLSILQIDAHLDLRESYQGTRHSHATAMHQCLPKAVRIVPVGVRCVGTGERELLAAHDIKPFWARNCHGSTDWLPQVVDALSENVYISIDIDGFDPAYAPGTGTPEPGGLDWYQVSGLLRHVVAERNVVAADLVEVLPLPGQVVTEFLAARVLYKLMSYVVAREQGHLR